MESITGGIIILLTPAPIIDSFRAWKPPVPYAIKNQHVASKIPPNGGNLRSKAPSRGLWMQRAGSLWHKSAGEASSFDQ